MRQRLLVLLPLLAFLVLAGYFLWGLNPDRDPSVIPSVLIDEPVPETNLPPLAGLQQPGIAPASFTIGEPVVVNFFASWCIPCRAEHPLIARLAEQEGLTVYGVNYKDKPDAAFAWLEDLGNPYHAVGADGSGRAGIDWGLTGVPETFIVDGEGVIRYRHVGPIDTTILEERILPFVETLR